MLKHAKRWVNKFELCVCFKCLSPQCSFCFSTMFVATNAFSFQTVVPARRLNEPAEIGFEMTVEVITSTNHNRSKHSYEPIRIPSNYLRLTCSKGGKNKRVNIAILLGFSFSVVEKLARYLKTIDRSNNVDPTNRVYYFPRQRSSTELP